MKSYKGLPSVTLGREGMPGATESEFEAWVTYVTDHIDATCGFDVHVYFLGPTGIQGNIVEADDYDRDVILASIVVLWNNWCDDGIPSTLRDGA